MGVCRWQWRLLLLFTADDPRDACRVASGAAAGKRPREMATSSGGEGSGSQPPAAKSLVDLNAERLAAEAKQGRKKRGRIGRGTGGRDRRRTSTPRQVNPKGRSVLKDRSWARSVLQQPRPRVDLHVTHEAYVRTALCCVT